MLVSRRRLLQNGMLIASGLTLVPSAFSVAMGAEDKPDDQPGDQSWMIGNELVARTVVFRPKTGLFTHKMTDLATRTDFIAPGQTRSFRTPEFSFQCGARTCAGESPSWDLLGAGQDALPQGKSLTIRLRHTEVPVEVSVVYSVCDGHAAIRKHLVLRNTGKEALHLSHMSVEALSISLGPANETTLLTQYGTTPRETFYTGRSEDAGLFVANGRTGDGVAVISEVPGYMKRTEIGGWDLADGFSLDVMYDTDLMPFERTLGPGEEFATASASLVLFRNGDGFNDPQWAVPSYTSKVLERRVDAQGPPWIYNTWEPFERGINHDIALQLIDAAGAMGMDVFTIDDGWQLDYGENTINTTAFPGGLKSIMDAVEAKGMRLGLWLPLAAIGEKTADFRPEWVTRDREGNPKTTGTMGGEKQVMCLASAFRDRAAARVIDAIERFKLAYVKLDITTIFNAYGEAPGCWAQGHDHKNWAESLGRTYEGISYVTGKIYEKHPDVLLDLTFELWGQKHIIDAGLLAAGDLDWMSNVDDRQPDSAGPLQARQLLYLRAASMPVEAMLIGNIHAELPTIQESFATVIGSAPLLLGDLRKLSAADRQWYNEKIAWFKKLRRSTKISDSFFPLGSWRQTTPAAWDGFARLARSGDGVIALFRNKSHAAEAVVQLPLLPPGKYSVKSVMSGKELGVFDKADWARGVPIKFSDTDLAEVLEVKSVHG